MFVFVGLGNPGQEYYITRHNIGWLFADFCQTYLATKASNFETKLKFQSQIATIELPDRKILLVKPITFMNKSGQAVRKIIDFYRLDSQKEFFLIHDDLDLAFGDYKITRGKGPKAHNGVNSVVAAVNTEDFVRLRIGIANDLLPQIKNQGKSVADSFVLDEFTRSEQDKLAVIFQNALIDLNQYTLR
ncbi:aminoacyl-tRNA hydrolase [Candidatus Beckwithbacteria bacterium CG23_combo_of_CG06-09_8_20_14_all_34_8]|uniref:Peptidyl-tRNA hydrolase n=1 Tax=Candidatus Beckwithbacteria bacterium CG23_combo_of_CG06-09_8_20_14_all_34_8 TaxID=1974497 RepID=A0A2H0B8B9_9BACT|nr:MAG: aminoacyl-tRNA hydrolase [Candidatus Beckwithbacteria bacterium CG23_combo_of_CG06-09_8_20_14_all_34_8]